MGFSQALSGLNAAKANLNTLGNNIANSQTVGFKSSTTLFADVFANADVGLGTQVSAVRQDFSDGNIESTSRELDLAISGEGFFRMQQNGETVYSRNGQLSMDADGYLVNAQGARLMGYGLQDANDPFSEVVTGGQPEVLQVAADSMPAKATDEVDVSFNLDASVPKFDGELVMDAQGRAIVRNDDTNVLYFAQSPSNQLADGPIVKSDGSQVKVDNNGAVADTGTNTVEYRDGELRVIDTGGNIVTKATTPPEPVEPALTAPSDSETIWMAENGDLYSVDANDRLVTSAGVAVTVSDADNTNYDVYANGGTLAAYTTGESPGAGDKPQDVSLAELNNPLQAAAAPEVDLADPSAYSYSSSSTIFDSQGNSRNLTLFYTRLNATTPDTEWNEWKVDARLDGGPTGAETASDSLGTVRFDSSGRLIRGGERDVQFDIGDDFEPLAFNLGLAGTQFSNDSTVNSLTQNGYKAGTLVGIEIEDDGSIVRNFSNEQSQAAGQIALANFRNPEGLKAAGDNAWTETAASGGELVGAPGTGVLGSVTAGAVETSNVDMASELVDMIVAQRAYQANSQTIKVQDEILQSAVNLR